MSISMLSIFNKIPTKYIYIPISINDHLTKDDLWHKVSLKPHFRAGINKSIEGSFTSQKAKQAVFTPFLPLHAAQVFLRE